MTPLRAKVHKVLQMTGSSTNRKSLASCHPSTRSIRGRCECERLTQYSRCLIASNIFLQLQCAQVITAGNQLMTIQLKTAQIWALINWMVFHSPCSKLTVALPVMLTTEAVIHTAVIYSISSHNLLNILGLEHDFIKAGFNLFLMHFSS